MKKYIFAIAFFVAQIAAVSQTVNVHFKNGQTIQYPSTKIDYVDFSEKASDPTVTAGAAVDLGLSIYWSSCNVGAEAPEEYGNYYAWGETSPKSNYTEKNYAYYDDNTKSYIDIGENICGTEYDAATVNLGSDWRMPTKEEIKELLDNCSWEWTQINGVNGYKVIAGNGNSIFLPAAGWKTVNGTLSVNVKGNYLTGSNVSSVISDAYYLNFSSSLHWLSNSYRYCGYSIRPVTSNPNAASQGQ